MIVIGGGVVDAPAELLELATLLQAPAVAFRNGRGVIADTHYLSHVLPGGYELWKTADVVLGIGSRMEQQLLHWKTPPGMKVIRIDIDAQELDRIQSPAVAIHADARAAIVELIAALRRLGARRAPRESELVTLKARVAHEIQAVQPQVSYLDAIRRALPRDGFFVDEITQVGYASWYALPVYEPRHLVSCGYQGTLGYGYATALGVKCANPRRAVVNIAGDGGFLFTSNEMAAAAQYNIALVTVLFNNGKFQNVQRQQKEWFGGRVIGSDLRNPDFVKYGESFGVRSLRVEGPEALEAAIRSALELDAPVLIEVPCGDMASPWPHIIKPPVVAAATGVSAH
jgi:acetolactate synthase-1/2/3 large subunit